MLLFSVLLTVASANAGMMLGGWNPVAADVDMSAVFDFATSQINARQNSMFLYQSDNLQNVQKQVVAGMNYKFTFDFTPTDCDKSSPKSVCNANDDEVERCDAQVYNKWNGEMSLSSFNCAKSTKRAGGLAGGISNAKVSVEALEAASLSLAKFNVENANTLGTKNLARTLSRVVSVRTQVVAGTNYYLTLETMNHVTGKLEMCNTVVWSQPWRKTNYMVTSPLKC